MSVNTFIECRQKKSKQVVNNGDYTTKLSGQGVRIDTGDQIQLNKAFIDTLATSTNRIEIEEDITLQMSHVFYSDNWTDLGKTYDSGSLGNTTNNLYVPCTDSGGSPVSDFERVDRVVAQANALVYGTWGNVDTTYSYVDVNGTRVQHTFFIKGGDVSKGVSSASSNLGFVYKKGTLYYPVYPSFIDLDAKYGIGDLSYYTSPVSNTVYHPINISSTLKIPTGSYDPDHLAKIITDGLSVNDKAITSGSIFADKEALDSPYLKNSKDLATTSVTFIETKDGTDSFILAFDHWVGSNIVSLEYDNETERMAWTYLHMPLYDTSGNIITQVTQQTYNPGGTGIVPTGKYFWSSRNSGIAWTALAATKDKDGSVYDFWTAKLGFDLSKLLVRYTNELKPLGGGAGLVPIFTNLSTEDTGTTTTSGFLGIDSAVQKIFGSGATTKFFQVPSYNVTPNFSTAIGTETEKIFSNDIFFQENNKFGYYLIDINASFKSDIIMEDTINRTIQGIVSRYYEQQSYTSATSDAAIAYVHKGEPIYLRDLRIRILKSDGTLADNIGDDNTVYLQVVKRQDD